MRLACVYGVLVVLLIASFAYYEVTATPTYAHPRVRRQLGFGGGIGYGGRAAGLQSALQGISSGYGYGYNNAVGLGGLGQAGAGSLAIPFGVGFGRR